MLVRQLKDYKTAYAYGKSEIIRTVLNAELKTQEVDNSLNCAQCYGKNMGVV